MFFAENFAYFAVKNRFYRRELKAKPRKVLIDFKSNHFRKSLRIVLLPVTVV